MLVENYEMKSMSLQTTTEVKNLSSLFMSFFAFVYTWKLKATTNITFHLPLSHNHRLQNRTQILPRPLNRTMKYSYRHLKFP